MLAVKMDKKKGIVVGRPSLGRQRSFTLLQVVELLGLEIPQLCFCNELFILGVCRLCGVWKHNVLKIAMSCAEEHNRGTGKLSTNRMVNKRHRYRIMNYHLSTHPLDCPICDQATECDLQEIAYHLSEDNSLRTYENTYSVTSFSCNSLVKATMTRCILCSRCVTWVDTKVVDNKLGFLGRGRSTEINLFTYTNAENSTYSPTLLNTMSFSLVDICPVGAFTSDIDKFTFRLTNSSSINTSNLFDWSRTPVRFEVNSGIVRVTPLTLRNDRILNMRNTFPILSDVSRLLYYDVLELKSSSSYTRSIIADEPSFFKETHKMKKHICYFVGVNTMNMLPSFTSSFTFSLFNNVSSLFNVSKEGVVATNSSIRQFFIYVDYLVSNAYFLNPKMSINLNSSFLNTLCLWHSPMSSNDSFIKVGRFLQIMNTSNLWTLQIVNSIISNMITQNNEFQILTTIASLDKVVEQELVLDSNTLSTLKSFDTLDGRSIPFFFALFEVTSSSVLSVLISMPITYIYQSTTNQLLVTRLSAFFKETSLTIAAMLYSHKIRHGVFGNVATNFSVSLVSKKI